MNQNFETTLEKLDLRHYYDAHLEHELFEKDKWQRALPLFRLMFSEPVVQVLIRYRNDFVRLGEKPCDV